MPKTRKPRKMARKAIAAEAKAANALAPRRKPQAKVVDAVGQLGDQPELRTVSGLVIATGLLTANRRLVRAGVRMLLAHEIATLAKNLIKRRIDRTRPHSARSHSDRVVKPGRHTAKTMTSFPSGHSAGSVAVARAFGREYPQHQAPAVAAAAVVAALQVPRLNHFPTDVAAGIALGVASEAAADLVMRLGERLEEAATPEAPPRPPPRA
ncbi:phosphatase PAP2 family protein [Sphingomonas sp.]|uniref:phosphatase PAP2 family protein n=1 Tax=Sphingomonas sp. TaxID=28214 RepID=UPI001792BABC|nr:phosphatase PAP2 family protein [Sphingomonas sp.]MBA3512738.1 phosphatase PAP2 family protein [Sphingomonas sp.]